MVYSVHLTSPIAKITHCCSFQPRTSWCEEFLPPSVEKKLQTILPHTVSPQIRTLPRIEKQSWQWRVNSLISSQLVAKHCPANAHCGYGQLVVPRQPTLHGQLAKNISFHPVLTAHLHRHIRTKPSCHNREGESRVLHFR